jgi:hypothetical protein
LGYKSLDGTNSRLPLWGGGQKRWMNEKMARNFTFLLLGIDIDIDVGLCYIYTPSILVFTSRETTLTKYILKIIIFMVYN